MAKQYAVIGHPVAHSLSPAIHAAFGRQQGIDLDYRAIDAGPDGFEAALAAFDWTAGLGAWPALPAYDAGAEWFTAPESEGHDPGSRFGAQGSSRAPAGPGAAAWGRSSSGSRRATTSSSSRGRTRANRARFCG